MEYLGRKGILSILSDVRNQSKLATVISLHLMYLNRVQGTIKYYFTPKRRISIQWALTLIHLYLRHVLQHWEQ